MARLFTKRMSSVARLLAICLVLNLLVAANVNAAPSENRLSGLTRYETAAAIAKEGWQQSDYAIIAYGENYPDALAAAPLARKYDAPILLTQQDSLPDVTKQALVDLKVKNVFIVGGSGVVSDTVKKDIESSVSTVTRLSGNDRYGTAIEIAKLLGDIKSIAVTTGEDYADALSIGSVAGKLGMPVVLVPKDYLPDSVKNYVSSHQIQTSFVIGNEDSISNFVLNQFPNSERITGVNKYERNIAVLNKFGVNVDSGSVCLATGNDFADALTGTAYASKKSLLIILLSDNINTATYNYIKNKKDTLNQITIFGGEGALKNAVVNSYFNLEQSIPSLEEDGTRKVVYIPANPDKGFYWGYYLVIPSNTYKAENKDYRRYLMVDTNNTGTNNNYEEIQAQAKREIEGTRQYSMKLAEKLWMPMLYPVFPNPKIGYKYNGETSSFYAHALERDIATLQVKLQDPQLKNLLTKHFNDAGYDVNALIRLDQQLSAMMDDAIQILNQNGHNVQANKVFLSGYSSSGNFTNRFTLLNPDKVKAVASGAALDEMVVPLKEYQGENLIFPIGISDYSQITGQDFNFDSFNKVARLIYMGENDGGEHNTVAFSGTYEDAERNIIIKLWGLDVLPRAQALTKLYGQIGVNGMYIIDKGIGHSYSNDMLDYLLQFFKENRDNDDPVYSIPSNPKQLEYTLYK